jgi:hypothetical protein
MILRLLPAVIACDKREAFAQGNASDEAIHSSICIAMDCFAALAMTENTISVIRTCTPGTTTIDNRRIP